MPEKTFVLVQLKEWGIPNPNYTDLHHGQQKLPQIKTSVLKYDYFILNVLVDTKDITESVSCLILKFPLLFLLQENWSVKWKRHKLGNSESVTDKYEFNQSQQSPRLSFLVYKIRITAIYPMNLEDQTNVIQTFMSIPWQHPLGWSPGLDHLSIFNLLEKGQPLHNHNCIHPRDLLGKERTFTLLTLPTASQQSLFTEPYLF